jgi:hypothetical protein
MRLYLAGNFNITDNITKENTLKTKLGKDYHRLCTYYYPRAAEVILTGEKDYEYPIITPIDETDFRYNNHPALKKPKIINTGVKDQNGKTQEEEKINRSNRSNRKIKIRKKSTKGTRGTKSKKG